MLEVNADGVPPIKAKIDSLVRKLAEQQAVPDGWWEQELKNILSDIDSTECLLAEAVVAMRTYRNAMRMLKDACIQAVRDEPEYPEEMPDEMAHAMCQLADAYRALNDKGPLTAAFRISVKETKKGIEERIRNIGEKNAQT